MRPQVGLYQIQIMKKIIYSVTLFSVMLLSGCESLVTNVELPKATPKLVVTSFISPQDSVVAVYLTESTPLFGISKPLEDNTIKNASVFISDGLSTSQLKYNYSTGHYEVPALTFPIRVGKTYSLSITAADGRKTSAMCTVPERVVEVANITLDSTIHISTGSKMWELKAEWTHIPGAAYYRCAASQAITLINSNSDTTYHTQNLFYNSDLTNALEKKANAYNIQRSNISIGNFTESNGRIIGYKTTSISVDIMIINAEYYRYHDSLYKYYNNHGNPFTEPTRLYSNIEGGLGVFAAYTSYKKKFTFD